MDENLREQIALFRFGVIRDLVSGSLAPGQKEAVLAEIVDKDWNIPGSTRCSIGRTTARDWSNAYTAMGFGGLKPRSRSDKGASRVIPEEVQNLLLEIRRARPKASIRSIIRAAELSGNVAVEVSLTSSTVHRLFTAHGMATKPAGKSQPDAVAFTHPHVGDLWMSDVMHGPRLLEPGRRRAVKTYLHAFIDDASRLVPFAAFYLTENSACFQDALKQALLRRGIPRRLYCDNGAIYRHHHLQIVCATLGITLIHSRPHQPRGRGKIERFFRHVRSAFLPHVTEQHMTDIAALNRVFWAWLEAEYHQTSHRGLEGRTPLERFLDDVALLRDAPEDLDQLMRMKVTRRVARDRTVRLEGRIYEAPDGFASEKIEVLYDPYDPTRPAHMRREGESEEYRLRAIDLETNARLRRRVQESEEPEPAPKTGISYLDLIAKKHYEQEK